MLLEEPDDDEPELLPLLLPELEEREDELPLPLSLLRLLLLRDDDDEDESGHINELRYAVVQDQCCPANSVPSSELLLERRLLPSLRRGLSSSSSSSRRRPLRPYVYV